MLYSEHNQRQPCPRHFITATLSSPIGTLWCSIMNLRHVHGCNWRGLTSTYIPTLGLWKNGGLSLMDASRIKVALVPNPTDQINRHSQKMLLSRLWYLDYNKIFSNLSILFTRPGYFTSRDAILTGSRKVTWNLNINPSFKCNAWTNIIGCINWTGDAFTFKPV